MYGIGPLASHCLGCEPAANQNKIVARRCGILPSRPFISLTRRISLDIDLHQNARKPREATLETQSLPVSPCASRPTTKNSILTNVTDGQRFRPQKNLSLSIPHNASRPALEYSFFTNLAHRQQTYSKKLHLYQCRSTQGDRPPKTLSLPMSPIRQPVSYRKLHLYQCRRSANRSATENSIFTSVPERQSINSKQAPYRFPRDSSWSSSKTHLLPMFPDNTGQSYGPFDIR